MKKYKEVLYRYYGIGEAKLKRLEGYGSINYKVDSGSDTYVLKQYPKTDENVNLIHSESAVLRVLENLHPFEFPKTIKSTAGELVVIDAKHIYRLLTFIKGAFLADVKHTDRLLESFGAFLGIMNKELLGLKDSDIAAKVTEWDLRHFYLNKRLIPHIENAQDRTLVEYFFMQHELHVSPIIHSLRKSIIHSDANNWNVLTKKGKVSGIIDFGDMCYSPIINDLAIAITYGLLDKKNPLKSAIPIIRGFHQQFALLEEELNVLYYLVAARLCTSLCNSAFHKKGNPNSDYITITEKPAWQLLHQWIAINPLKAKDTFRKAAGFSSVLKKSTSYSLKERKKYTSKALSLSYKRPIEMTQSALQYMYDAQGNTFLDAYNNIMIVGHCHPKVVVAGQQTMATLNTNTRYLYSQLNSYSEKLLGKFPKVFTKIFFVNSGSAATDLATRLALVHTKKRKIAVIEHGYHGNTRNGIDISHYKYANKGGAGQKDHIIQVRLPDTFNGKYTGNTQKTGKKYAEDAIKLLSKSKGEIAAFIAEPIVGCGGQIPLAKGYLKKMYLEIRKQGGLCISDEVQVGFGRLGNHFWGFEMHDVVPDIVVLGKPIGNGHPLAAVVTTNKIAKSFENGMEFFSSFGGNPVSCAIGEAVLDVIEAEKLQQHAKKVGNHLKRKLKALKKEVPEIGDVRGSGLFLGIDLITKKKKPNTKLASIIKNELRNRHILVSTDGPYDNVIKIKPPLYFNKENADILVTNIADILSKFTPNKS
ncbi:aminotransferase class III-fold pyridoxal phosphate-dependent enzyme [Spongiivirga citrea]|uniref:Aminotransferase class III-fold pyridoxal phosphate-dependent enzyme n=1 Tax=Spongiivirga citrea TaxID=1481457 RepID=A0A6M0CJK1_9FLAO|nr:aminotransferase class III-fold pyridoxal phosphate-dependent enzyme [Spongiivirga citrea]NER18021.1 aminotransferase class III-fold pyridoxal phosphate-dependent enzyme [Spongiivirga citrea]